MLTDFQRVFCTYNVLWSNMSNFLGFLIRYRVVWGTCFGTRCRNTCQDMSDLWDFFRFWDKIHILTDRIWCRLTNYSIFTPMTSLLFYLAVIPWQLAGNWATSIVHSCQKDVPAQKNDGGTGNLHKRLDGRFNDCITAVIGLKVQDPVPVHPMTVRMIFFCPHTGTSNIAPAEDAGVTIAGNGRSTTPTGNALTCSTTLAHLSCLLGQQGCLACII